MADDAIKSLIPQFTGDNFSSWIFRLECLLEEKQCKEAIGDNVTEVPKSKDAKARNLIVSSLPDKYLEYVRNASTARDMIVNLKKVFKRKSTLSALYIRKKLLTLKCKNDTVLSDHFNTFDTLIRQIEETGCVMGEQDKVCHLLLTIAEGYDTTIAALETANTELTVDYVKSKLLDAELKNNNNTATETQSHSFITCYKCHKVGHKSYECRTQRGGAVQRGQRTRRWNRGRGSRRGGNFQYSMVEQSSTDDMTAISAFSTGDHFKNSINDDVQFIIDSGATDHLIMSKYIPFMTDIVTLNKEIKIYIANGEYLVSKSKGNCILQ